MQNEHFKTKNTKMCPAKTLSRIQACILRDTIAVKGQFFRELVADSWMYPQGYNRPQRVKLAQLYKSFFLITFLIIFLFIYFCVYASDVTAHDTPRLIAPEERARLQPPEAECIAGIASPKPRPPPCSVHTN